MKIKQYGGNPVECEYYLEGPEGSLYEGGTFIFKVVYLNGYPYNCPETFMVTRFVSMSTLRLLSIIDCSLFCVYVCVLALNANISNNSFGSLSLSFSFSLFVISLFLYLYLSHISHSTSLRWVST